MPHEAAQSHHFPTGSATYLNYLTTATTDTAHYVDDESDQDSPISRFQRYLRIKTAHPDPDYATAVAFLRSQAQEIDLHTQVLEFGPGKPLLLVIWYGSNPSLPSVLLNSHMDSVPAEPSKWLHPPFSAVRTSDGKIFARGSQDDKSIAIQCLEAIRNLRNQDFIPVRFMMDEGQASPGDEFRVGYCQGLNYVAALLLLVMKTEEDAFWMLAVLLENVLVSDCYTTNLSGCHVEQRVFKDLLTKKIAAHLEALDVDVSLVAIEWFLCLFSKSLSSEMRIPVLGFSPMINTPILLHDHNEFLSDSVFIRGTKVYESLISALSSFQEDVSSQ
ncbi:aminoacylase-1-like [Cucumis melo var. makuwa]|uniref:Aminoacylase-1-like n=1 Tax=Cucumis melo var. makuwa TaxID=1194695 RepID=A0A5A7ST64_CUCMM|nr:aminoacylase-1-like [Cucumis melo var. makuwa]